jgi:hypothetical protein
LQFGLITCLIPLPPKGVATLLSRGLQTAPAAASPAGAEVAEGREVETLRAVFVQQTG